MSIKKQNETDSNTVDLFDNCIGEICDKIRESPNYFMDEDDHIPFTRLEIKDVVFLKKAYCSGNLQEIKNLYSKSTILHAIMWVVYFATNHKTYSNTSFGNIPDDTDCIRFLKNMVDMFVEEGLVKLLLRISIKGSWDGNILPNLDVVKMIIPTYVNLSDKIYKYSTPYEYWETGIALGYDPCNSDCDDFIEDCEWNDPYIYVGFEGTEGVTKNKTIGSYLRSLN